MRRWLFLGAPLLILISIMAATRFVIQPGLEIWALSQAQALISEKTPVEMAAESLDLSWVPLKISLKNPRVRAKPGSNLGFDLVGARRAEARVDFYSLLSGQLRISTILLEGLEAKVNLDPFLKGNGPTPEIPWDQIFSLADELPVSSVALRENNLKVWSEKFKFQIDIRDLNARLSRQTQKLSLEIQTGSSSALWEMEGPRELRWSLGGEVIATPQAIEISPLRLATPQQSLELSGILNDTRLLLKSPKGRLSAQFKSNLGELNELLPQKFGVPVLQGHAEIDTTLDIVGLRLPRGNFRFNSQGLYIGEAEIGNFDALGNFDDKIVKIPELRWKQSSGEAFARDFELSFSDPRSLESLSVKAKIATEKLGLHQLLKGIDVGDLPVDLQISADLDCGGPLLPRPNVVCVGKASGRDLLVQVEEKKKWVPLVRLAEFSADGGLQITDEAVSYQAKAKVGSDTGSSSGMISYKKGFLIHYETPSVKLSHVGSIAGLKLEGSAAIKGSTTGDSDAATFEMQVQGQELFFEDFFLGNAEGVIEYEKGNLFFNDLKGKIHESSYEADVEADLLHSRIKVDGETKSLRLEDLFSVFQRQFTLPVNINGRASARIELEGPFQLGRLSYDLDAKIPQLSIAGENFKDGDLKIVSVRGEAKTERARFKKGSQSIEIQGVGHPDGQVEIDLVGNQLLLEESENITSLGSNISGFLDLGVQMRGFILDPNVSVQAQLGQMVIEDQEFPPSAAAVEINRKRIEGSVRLFAGRLFGDFVFPFVNDHPFRLKLQASDWSFATLATLIGGGRLLSEYESAMTGDLSLSSEKGGLWTASGEGTISNFLLRRGSQSLRNQQPMRMRMINGSASLENVHLEGGAESVDISAQQISKEALRMKVQARISLRILQLFVPFLEELGGEGRINANVSGRLLRPEILGSAQLSDGFARIKGFPHPIERASADVQFSASRVQFNDIRATLAGGSVTGDGSLLLLGPRNIPVNIRAQAEGVTLNVPDRIQTTGDLDLTFTGSWFPYTLAGSYRVYGGLFSKELEDESTSTRVQQSAYLPKAILQSAFEPVLLDIQVDLVRPLQLKNSMIDGQATGQLRILGPPQSPGITGVVNVPSGTKITFRDKIFDVNSATLKFNDPKDLNPELFVSARARINEYDINLTVQGTAKNPLIRMASTPPLSDNDIISLLALGMTSQKLERQSRVGTQKETDGSYEIGTAIIQNVPLTKSLQKTLGVNLQFSSSYDDTKNIAVKKVTLSKQLSDRINASVTSAQGDQNSTEARVQYYLNPNLSAVGTFENRQRTEGSSLSNQDNRSESIFGIDLEFKQEFK